MDLDKLNNIVNSKKTKEAERIEKERLEQLKKEKEKKDSLDKIQALFNGEFSFTIISTINNISDDDLQEAIEQCINENYDADKYILNILVCFPFIKLNYESVVDEEEIHNMMEMQNQECDCDWTYDTFLQEVRREPGALESYLYNHYYIDSHDIYINFGNTCKNLCNIHMDSIDFTNFDESINNIKNNYKLFLDKPEEVDYDCEECHIQYYIGKKPTIQEIEDALKTRLEDFGFKIIDIKSNESVWDNIANKYTYDITIKNPVKN